MTPKQQEVNVGAPVSNDDPLMIAWKAYQATENYANSKAWALHIAPMVQAGDPTAERKRRFEIMPFDQRERHVEGSLWAAFMEGWNAGRAALSAGGTE